MAENVEPSQELDELQEVDTIENSPPEEIKDPSEVPPTKDNEPLEILDPSSTPWDSTKPSTDTTEINNTVEVQGKLSNTQQGRIEKSEEVQDNDDYDEVEEEFEEECEDNGEVKVVMTKRIVKVKKNIPSLSKGQTEEEEEVEEEYEEEELDETGATTVVIKKRMVKVKKKPPSRRGTIASFVEQEEEYEEEEVNEEGETITVKKVRLIKIKNPKKTVSRESEKSFDEVEEEYSEEELNENGELVTVKKKKTVKVPKKITKKSHETITGEDTKSYKSVDRRLEKRSEEEENVQKIDDREKIDEEEEAEEEEVFAEEEEIIGEGEIPVEKVIRRKKKKKVQKEKVSAEDLAETDSEKKSKKRRRHRRKTSRDREMSRSETSIASLKEEDEEDTLREEIEEEKGEDGAEQSEVSVSSSEQRLADERAAIAEQFEILQKLRSEHVSLRKKNFYLSNKLVNYFKKQKMDHVFTETKENPEMEQRLVKKLIQFYESNQEINEEKLKINSEWEAQLSINEDLHVRVNEGWESLMVRKRELAAKLINSRTGRTIANDKAVEDVLARQEMQQKQLSDCRQLEIKLKHRINAKKQERQMDHMGMDFNLMDYEKLSSLMEYYTDKITERDIEIGEVSEKLASMEDKLRRAKDQLKRRENELGQERWRLQNISSELDRKRLDLNKVKATRHKTEKNTAKIKQQSGLLAYPTLLKDYDDKAQQLEELTAQTDALKRSYKNTTRRIEKLRDTIRRKTLLKYSSYAGSSTSCTKK